MQTRLLGVLIFFTLVGASNTSTGQMPTWGQIKNYTSLVNGNPGTKYNNNDTISNRCGATGTNIAIVPMRVILSQTIRSLPPNSTIVAEKTRTIIVQPGKKFTFKVEAIDPAYNTGAPAPGFFISEARLYMEEIGGAPAPIPGDSKSTTMQHK